MRRAEVLELERLPEQAARGVGDDDGPGLSDLAAGAPPDSVFFSEEYRTQHRVLVGKGNLEAIVRFHTSLVFPEPATRELQELFVRRRLDLPHETMLSFFDPDPTVDVTQILGEIAVPVLVIHGSADRLIDPGAARFIATRLPSGRVYFFEDKGHMPLFTATDEFCNVLRRFVRTGDIPEPV